MTAWNDLVSEYDRDTGVSRDTEWGVDAAPGRRQRAALMARIRGFVREHPAVSLAIAAAAVTVLALVLRQVLRRRRSA